MFLTIERYSDLYHAAELVSDVPIRGYYHPLQSHSATWMPFNLIYEF